MHVTKGLMVNCYLKTISYFFLVRFLIYFLTQCHVTYRVRVLRGVSWLFRMVLIYIKYRTSVPFKYMVCV